MVCSNSDQGMGTNGAGLWNTNENFHGIELDGTSSCLYGLTVSTMTTKLWRVNSSTDLFYYRIYNAAGSIVATTTGVAQNTLSSSAGGVLLQLSFTSSHVMADGDRIGLYYAGSEGIRMVKSDDVQSGVGYLGVKYQGGWSTDSVYQGYVTTDSTPAGVGGRLPPPPIVLGGL